MAVWLDGAFYAFDNSILGFWHGLAQSAGVFFTPFMKVISAFGYKGLCMLLIGVVLCLFKSTRKMGGATLISILFGFLLTNLLIKNLVGRARPYTHPEYLEWWKTVGSPTESEYSFPSGHTTVATVTAISVFVFSKPKKITWLCLLFPIIMGVSRNYLMVHYPTDVIAAIVIGGLASAASAFLTKYIYKLFDRHKEKPFCNFILNASVTELFKKTVDNQEK